MGSQVKRRKVSHHDGDATSAGRLDSFSFSLQVSELLAEEKVDYDQDLADVGHQLREIKRQVEAIEPKESLSIPAAAATLLKHGVRAPFPDPRPRADSKHQFVFAKGTVKVVGSYVSRCMRSGADRSIDMIVVMPAETLMAKDDRDFRYFWKRTLYLAVISSHLKQSLDKTYEYSFERFNGNQLTPILVLRRPESKYKIQIMPVLPDGFFPQHKLQIRVATKANHDPFYYSTLHADATCLTYSRLLGQVQQRCADFSDACILGRIWLQQRGFGGSTVEGGFGTFEWGISLALLLSAGGKGHAPLSCSLSSTLLFKAMVQWLSVTDLSRNPCFLGGKADLEMPVETPLLYDTARQHNIAFKMTLSSASLLHHYAKSTRALLNDHHADQFTPTFLLRADNPLQNFDLLARVHCESIMKEVVGDGRGRLDIVCNRIETVLRKGLAERARLISVRTGSSPCWQLSDSPADRSPTIEVSLLFEPIKMASSVDKGPSVDDKDEARAFRQFWGQKAELRKFSGEVLETVVWTAGSSATEICQEMIGYLLKHRLGLDLEHHLTFHGTGFAALVPLKTSDMPAFAGAEAAFRCLEKDLRALDLPLQVRHVEAIDATLRHAALRPPAGANHKSGPRPMDVVVSFETNSKWPDSLPAIQRTKISFLLLIGRRMEEGNPGRVTTYMGLTPGEEMDNLAHVDIVYTSSFSFRIRVQTDQEIALLERDVKNKMLSQHVKMSSALVLAKDLYIFRTLPLHTKSISTYRTRFPALSGSIRLVKKWMATHHLLCHFKPEAVELIVLRVFLAPPDDVPSSPMTAFTRAISWLARWDWRSEPLIIDTSGHMSAADRASLRTRFVAFRTLDPTLSRTAAYVIFAHDQSGSAYSSEHGLPLPSKLVAGRLTSLARSACVLMKEQAFDLDPRRLFVPALKEYDVLMHLNGKTIKKLLRTYATDDMDDEGVDEARARYKNLDRRVGEEPLPVVRHPVEVFLGQLRDCYSDALVFFHGAPDNHLLIGAVWNPQLQHRTFRVNLPASYRPPKRKHEDGDGDGDGEDDGDDDDGGDDDDDVVEMNREAMLAEIARVGGELIERIETRT